MYYINTTVNIQSEIKTEALEWIEQYFIPKVISLIGFSQAKIMLVITDANIDGETYALQFKTNHKEVLSTYEQKKVLIAQWIKAKFGDKVLHFTTTLQTIKTF